MFGKYLLFFGGFNGNYLNDFYYIELKDNSPSSYKDIQIRYTRENLLLENFAS